jgi:hypothetical protein
LESDFGAVFHLPSITDFSGGLSQPENPSKQSIAGIRIRAQGFLDLGLTFTR